MPTAASKTTAAAIPSAFSALSGAWKPEKQPLFRQGPEWERIPAVYQAAFRQQVCRIPQPAARRVPHPLAAAAAPAVLRAPRRGLRPGGSGPSTGTAAAGRPPCGRPSGPGLPPGEGRPPGPAGPLPQSAGAAQAAVRRQWPGWRRPRDGSRSGGTWPPGHGLRRRRNSTTGPVRSRRRSGFWAARRSEPTAPGPPQFWREM